MCGKKIAKKGGSVTSCAVNICADLKILCSIALVFNIWLLFFLSFLSFCSTYFPSVQLISLEICIVGKMLNSFAVGWWVEMGLCVCVFFVWVRRRRYLPYVYILFTILSIGCESDNKLKLCSKIRFILRSFRVQFILFLYLSWYGYFRCAPHKIMIKKTSMFRSV